MKKLLFTFLGISLLVYSCYKYPDITVREGDQDMTITRFDSEANFGNYLTFEIVDTIPIYREKNGREVTDTLDDELASEIRNEISSYMRSRGYEIFVPNSTDDKPDLFFNVSVSDITSSSTYVGTGCYPAWGGGWGGYYPCWGGYYGCGGGYYGCWPYSYVDTYYSRTGTITIEMGDMINASGADKNIPVLWVATLAGYIENYSNNDIQRIDRGITEAFDQSEYIKR